ncbi:MAG: hypothetical protein AB8F34_08455 [Akkermansiaceae bacterium]
MARRGGTGKVSTETAADPVSVWYACGGKFGGSAAEQRAITWGIQAQRRIDDQRVARRVSAANQISPVEADEESAEAIVVGLKRVGERRMPESNNETRFDFLSL